MVLIPGEKSNFRHVTSQGCQYPEPDKIGKNLSSPTIFIRFEKKSSISKLTNPCLNFRKNILNFPNFYTS